MITTWRQQCSARRAT